MVLHKLAPGDAGVIEPMDIATRQMPTASFDLGPAGDVEILGIATATCLLAFFLCYTLYMGLWMSPSASFAEPYANDAPHITKPASKRRRFPRPVCEWYKFTSNRPQASHPRQHEEFQTPYFTYSARNARVKRPEGTPILTKQYYYTQIPARGKPLSRKRLPMSSFTINSNRRKYMALDTEEGLGSRPSTTVAVADKCDRAIRSNEVISYREPKGKENRGHSDKSFLRYHTASL
ncbi:hypothetical protein EKO27_g7086 [Xylaria grammica]|uniref:Uncharacterized protein n=1 Tax=Xylaria grammica TaxID=363999 RepID=A0A439D0U9_9PEZI|nr:hypothetical protein EKO27_g7086 [Xylaria grammica]